MYINAAFLKKRSDGIVLVLANQKGNGNPINIKVNNTFNKTPDQSPNF